MKKIILLIILLAFLAGGAIGGMAMLGIGPFPQWLNLQKSPVAKAAPPPPEESKKLYYDVGSYIVPVVKDRQSSREISIDLSIEVLPKDAERIGAALPKLQNAFTAALFEVIQRHFDPRSAADKQAIHDRLLIEAAKVFGEGAVTDIIIRAMYER